MSTRTALQLQHCTPVLWQIIESVCAESVMKQAAVHHHVVLLLRVFSFHQDSHLLPQSGGGRSKEDHQLTTGADKKCKTTYCIFSSVSQSVSL